MAFFVIPDHLAKKADFYYQLSTLLSAGVSVLQALDSVRNHSRVFRRGVELMIVQLESGATFTDAFRSAGIGAPVFDIALIDAGEQSGRLPTTLRLLASYYEQQATLIRSVISSLLYPLLLVHFAILVFPPIALTRLVSSGDVVGFLRPKLILLGCLYAVMIAVIFVMQGNRGAALRAFLEMALHPIPIVGTARWHLALARFSAALHGLVAAGVGVVYSWEVAAEASGSPRLQRGVAAILPSVQAGQSPGDLLPSRSEFPEVFSSLYRTGELSGQLEETLQRLFEYYQESASNKLKALANWIPKLIYLVIAAAIASMIFSFYSSYFSGGFITAPE